MNAHSLTTLRLKKLAVCLGISALGVAGGSAKAEDTLQLDGIRPGMSKGEALAALKRARPSFTAFDQFTLRGPGGMLVTLSKSNVRPADPAFFTTLMAAPVKSEGDLQTVMGSLCTRRPAVSTLVRVLFTADLLDPRVVLVDEYNAYCDHKATSESVLVGLAKQFPGTPTRQYGVRRVDGRPLIDAQSQQNGVSLLEWRDASKAGSTFIRNTVDQSPYIEGRYGEINGFGNPGMGPVATALVYTGFASTNYPEFMETLLWDDSAMVGREKQLGQILDAMDRLGVSMSMTNQRANLEKVMATVPAAQAKPRP